LFMMLAQKKYFAVAPGKCAFRPLFLLDENIFHLIFTPPPV